MRIVLEADTTHTGAPIFFPINTEAVEMFITPVEGDVEDGVEIGNGGVTADEEVAPDERTDAA